MTKVLALVIILAIVGIAYYLKSKKTVSETEIAVEPTIVEETASIEPIADVVTPLLQEPIAETTPTPTDITPKKKRKYNKKKNNKKIQSTTN